MIGQTKSESRDRFGRGAARTVGAVAAAFVMLIGACALAVSPAAAEPLAVPSAPTGLNATAGVSSVSIAFATGSDGGDPITKYQYTLDYTGTWSDVSSGGTSSPVSITGLTNGTTYSIKLRAVNGVGDGDESSPVLVTPFTTPSAPTSLDATAGDSSASISFTPGDNGGDGITKYEYKLDDSGSWSDVTSGVNSPASITGLTNGTSYSIKLRASNDAGAGAESSPVSVTPYTTPSAPTSLVATAGDSSVSIAFTAGSDGGDAITKYQYTLDLTGIWSDVTSGVNSPASITGLTNGTSYSIKLRAYSDAGGEGAESSPVEVTPFTTPSAPTSLVATPGDGSVSIAFTAGSDGGDAITKYEYMLDDSGIWFEVSSGGASSPSSITGLTNETTYSIKLRASNAAGAGAESSPVSVTPYVPASAPTGLVATPGSGSVSIAFTAGAAGTYAITKYQYKIGSGAWLDAPAGTSSPVVISGLTNYVVNSIKLRAYSAGGGTESAPVSVTTRIASPVIVTAYSASQVGNANRGLYVGFTGVTASGATMVSYRINVYAKGTNTVVATALLRPTLRGCFLGGLTRGVEYDIRVVGFLTLTGSPTVRSTFESPTQTVKV